MVDGTKFEYPVTRRCSDFDLNHFVGELYFIRQIWNMAVGVRRSFERQNAFVREQSGSFENINQLQLMARVRVFGNVGVYKIDEFGSRPMNVFWMNVQILPHEASAPVRLDFGVAARSLLRHLFRRTKNQIQCSFELKWRMNWITETLTFYSSVRLDTQFLHVPVKILHCHARTGYIYKYCTTRDSDIARNSPRQCL